MIYYNENVVFDKISDKSNNKFGQVGQPIEPKDW